MNEPNNRILIADDNPSIHDDFRKILPTACEDNESLNALLSEVLGDDAAAGVPSSSSGAGMVYDIDDAYQGEEALAKIAAAEAAGAPYALVFMDVRMPPGMDGIAAIRQAWAEHPHLEMVICTAYSDYSWEEILEQIGSSDQLQFLRKPFDVVSVKQMALALTRKWNLGRKVRQYIDDLEREVAARTRTLADKVVELQRSMDEIQTLRGILPMCAYCHKVRSDDNYWQRVDEYIRSHTPAEISHGVCPECYDKVLAPLLGKKGK